MPECPIYVRVQESLKELGDTPDAIAEHLHELGIIGVRWNACACPIARFLVRRHPGYAVVVGTGQIIMAAEDVIDEYTIETPETVKEFIDRFDRSIYQTLIEYA